uniref:Uncharacterized protein n=1 Tax=Anguilla anguilla TaxID=7936 RepID=A0A0E9W2P1_ANGAN
MNRQKLFLQLLRVHSKINVHNNYNIVK